MPVHDWKRVGSGIFHDFHLEWISSIKRTLNSGLLPEGYYALAEQVAGGMEPDVLALEDARLSGLASNDRPAASTAERGAVALAESPPRVRFTSDAELEAYTRKRRHVVIRHSSRDRVVALVEIVSPGNKDSRHALRSFVSKAIEYLRSGIHLLVLDLFPPTPRDPQGIHQAIWSEVMDESFELPVGEPLTLAAYAAGPILRAFVEPTAVGQELPEMPLFLEPERYVSVPLMTAYDSAFAAVPARWQAELTATN